MSTIDLIGARDRHLDHLLSMRRAPDTIAAYNRVEQDFLGFLDSRGIPPKLEALNLTLLDQYLDHEKWFAPRDKGGHGARQTLATRRTVLKAWGLFLYQKQILKDDPFKAIRGRSLKDELREEERRERYATELGQAIEACMASALVEGATRATIRTYRAHLDQLLRYAVANGFTTPGSVTTILVRAVAAERLTPDQPARSHKGGEAAAHGVICAAKYLARWANRNGIRMPDLGSIKAPRPPTRVQPRVTADEFRALEQAVVQRILTDERRFSRFTIARDLALLSLLGDTGLRASEVCALNVEDIDFESGAVLVGRGKGGNGRALNVLDPDPTAEGGGATLQALRNYLAQRAHVWKADADSGPLWISPRGNRLSVNILRSVLVRICADAGLDGNRPVHAFRRAHFTEAYRNDPGAIKVLAARMGWSPTSNEMIDTYTRGAMIDLARTKPLPSVTRQWRGGPTVAQARTGLALGQVGAEHLARRGYAALSADLLLAIRNNPELVRTLLEVMGGGAETKRAI